MRFIPGPDGNPVNERKFAVVSAGNGRNLSSRKALFIASNVRAGTVWVNCYAAAAAPFGGIKQSINRPAARDKWHRRSAMLRSWPCLPYNP